VSDAADPAAASPAATGRILTAPNVITLVRLACIPVFLWLLFGVGSPAWAAGLLGVLGATDWVDGFVARRYGQVSELGKVLDPVADRLLLLVGVTAILIDGSAPVWFGVAVLVREVLVAGATLVLASLGARRIDVTWWGKAGTFGLLFAFPFFLASHSTVAPEMFRVLAWVCGIPGLILSYVALVRYVPLGVQALRDGRGRSAPDGRSPGAH
jgi:cardiolipin synthase